MNFGKINAENIHYLKYFCHLECYRKKIYSQHNSQIHFQRNYGFK